jgi:hypothetical protein
MSAEAKMSACAPASICSRSRPEGPELDRRRAVRCGGVAADQVRECVRQTARREHSETFRPHRRRDDDDGKGGSDNTQHGSLD